MSVHSEESNGPLSDREERDQSREAALRLVAQRLLEGDPALARRVGLALDKGRGRVREIAEALARCMGNGADKGRLSAACGVPVSDLRELLELGVRPVLSSQERSRISELLTPMPIT